MRYTAAVMYTSYYHTRESIVLCGTYLYLPVAVYYNIMIVGFTEHALVYRDNILLLLLR